MSPFYTRLPDVGGFGVEQRVDLIGAALAAGAAAGVGAHALATGVHQIRERRKARELPVDRVTLEPLSVAFECLFVDHAPSSSRRTTRSTRARRSVLARSGDLSPT